MSKSKIIIIPDVHLKTGIVDKIIEKEKPNLTICLSDVFDDFFDTPEDAKRAAIWLKRKLHDKKFIFTVGNHCTSYLGNNKFTRCSGWTQEKQDAIDSVLSLDDWRKFKWFHFLNKRTLITHAGLTLTAFAKLKIELKDLPAALQKASQEAWDALVFGDRRNHWLFQCGPARGGNYSYSGVTWCDFNREFEPIEGLSQLMGHTIQASPRFENFKNSFNLCLDTHLKHYLIWKGSVKGSEIVEVK